MAGSGAGEERGASRPVVEEGWRKGLVVVVADLGKGMGKERSRVDDTRMDSSGLKAGAMENVKPGASTEGTGARSLDCHSLHMRLATFGEGKEEEGKDCEWVELEGSGADTELDGTLELEYRARTLLFPSILEERSSRVRGHTLLQ